MNTPGKIKDCPKCGLVEGAIYCPICHRKDQMEAVLKRPDWKVYASSEGEAA